MGLWTSKWTRQIWWPSCDSKFLATLLAVTILSNAVVASALDPIGSGSGIHRRTRQADGGEPEATAEPEGEAESEPEPTKSPIGLSEILGLLFLVCCILYCIGISYKIYKICKGTYVEEEPVFLKYK